MAFRVPVRRDAHGRGLAEELRAPAVHVHTTGRLVLRVTLGLRLLQADLVAARHWPTSVSCQTSDDGRLYWIGKQGPIIMKRYRLLKAIGAGSFSDVFLGEDVLMGKRVAVKVILGGCEALGRREKLLLDVVGGRYPRGPCYFVQALGCAILAERLCLLMSYYPCTLMAFLQRPEPLRPSSPEPIALPADLLRPRPVRGTVGKGAKNLDVQQVRPAGFTEQGIDTDDLRALRRVSLHLVCALCLLHRENVIHGDLKPENCFVDAALSEEGDTRVLRLRQLPADFAVRLGDMSNSLHTSEVSEYFRTFDLQSLPYRAPEVLLGLPFGFGIDMWSLGVLLAELVLGRPMFTQQSRPEQLQAMEQTFGSLSRTRFSGGKYSDLLFTSQMLPARIPASAERLEQRKLLRRLLLPHFAPSTPSAAALEAADFLGGLLAVDPDVRMTAMDALQHPFLAAGIPLPPALYCPPAKKPLLRPQRADAHPQFESLRREGATKRRLDEGL